MEDPGLEIANLQVRISMLRRDERRWLTILGDDSQSSMAHNEARQELRKVMTEILAASTAINKLEPRR
jgi:hypothetical protein